MHFTLVTQEDGLSANYVTGLFENPKGDLWVSHFDGGLSCGHRIVDRDLHWLPFTPADGLPGDASINETADQRGRHWLVSNLGLREYLREATSKGISTGRLVEASGLPNEPVISIKKSSHSSFWLATYHLGGLFRCSPAGKDGLSFEQFTGLDGLPDDHLLYTVEDRQGRLWISTTSHGLSLCKNPYSETPRFSNITIADGLANNQVTSLLEDRQGTIWIGTYGGGLSRLEETHTHSYTAEHDGLADNGVMSLCQDQQGDLWIGTWNGVSRYDGQNFHPVKAFANRQVNGIAEDRQGRLWFIVGEVGLCCFDGQDFTYHTEKDGLSNHNMTAVLVDQQEGVWCATARGLSCYHGDGFSSYPTDLQVTCLAEDRQGCIWFGLWGGGVSRYDGAHFTTFTAADGLAHNMLRSIYEDP
jgi:ligand-binding sensor domain-containing protein